MTEDSTRTLSCEERIDSHLAGREEQFGPWLDPQGADGGDVIAAVSDYEPQWTDPRGEDESAEEYGDRMIEDARQWIEDHPETLEEQVPGVGVEVNVELTITLSGGGPADFITGKLDVSDGSVSDVVYHFQDWFDGAHRPVTSGPIFDLAQRFGAYYEGRELSDLERD